MSTGEQDAFMAKVCEQTERYEDMITSIKKLATLGRELTNEERNTLSVAFKNVIGPRRTSWRVLQSIEARDKKNASLEKFLPLLHDYKKKVEDELSKYCNELLDLIDSELLKHATTAEAKVFFLKLKADYLRYIAEYSSSDQLTQVSDKALQVYQEATKIASQELKTTHPVRLGLALNFSVFYYEVLNDPSKACTTSKEAFDNAIQDLDALEEDLYKDSTTIMQLLRDNLTLWAGPQEENTEQT